MLLVAALFASPLAAEPAAATRTRPVGIDPGPLAGVQSLVWVAAHPDDEVIVAPLLASICAGRGARCTLILVTRGERGECLLPGGCAPTLASVRSAEAAISSERFGADLVLLSLPDSAGEKGWELAVGGREELLRLLSSYIAATAAEAVLTFDPRHGTTCHEDHRAVGRLVAEAITLLQPAPPLYFVETRIAIDPAVPSFTFGPAWPMGSEGTFDANRIIATLGISGWDALIATMRVHRSQFDENWILAAGAVPPPDRAVWLAPAEVALAMPVVPCDW